MLFNYCFLMSNMTYLIYFCLHPPSSLKQNPFPFLVSTGSERHPGSHRCGLWSIGAHGLKSYTSDPSLLESWKTAASYQMLHVPCLGDDGFLRKEWLINQE